MNANDKQKIEDLINELVPSLKHDSLKITREAVIHMLGDCRADLQIITTLIEIEKGLMENQYVDRASV